MFHRNLLALPDHPPAFPTTLVTESGTTCADPRSGSSFGRMAEQSSITRNQQKKKTVRTASLWWDSAFAFMSRGGQLVKNIGREK